MSKPLQSGDGGAVTIPETINGLPVTSIGGRAFRDCANLTSVTIPGCVTNIGYQAFISCVGLTNVTFGLASPVSGPKRFAAVPN